MNNITKTIMITLGFSAVVCAMDDNKEDKDPFKTRFTVQLQNGMIVDRLEAGGMCLRGCFTLTRPTSLRKDMTDQEFIDELKKVASVTSVKYYEEKK
ncbi:MAG: hypothetical protein ACTSXG_02205 [Alphaproteobacteria bacterium]